MLGFFKTAFVHNRDFFVLPNLKYILNQKPSILQYFLKAYTYIFKIECMCRSLHFVSKKLKIGDYNEDKQGLYSVVHQL